MWKVVPYTSADKEIELYYNGKYANLTIKVDYDDVDHDLVEEFVSELEGVLNISFSHGFINRYNFLKRRNK